MLAVGSAKGVVALWSLRHPRHPHPLGRRQLGGKVNDLAFTADGRSLFVAGKKGGVAFGVNGKGFTASDPVKKVSGEGTAVATAPNGSYAFGGKGGIELWDAVRGRRLHMAQPGEVDTLAFARGGSILVSGGTDWNVTTWDVASGRPFGPPRTFERLAADDVAVSPDGRTILAGGEDHLLKLWPLQPASALATTVGSVSASETRNLPQIAGLAVGDEGRAVAAAGPTGTSLWSLRDPSLSSPPKPLAQIPGASRVVAYHGNILVTGRGYSFAVYGTGRACRGKGEEPCLLASPSPHSEEQIYGLALASSGKRLLLATSGSHHGSGGVNLWDLTDAESGVVTHLPWLPVGSLVDRLAFSPTDPLLAVGTEDGKVQVWDVSDPGSPKEVDSENPHGNENQPVDALAFSPDGAWLASGGADQQVALWRVIHPDSGPVAVKPTPGTLTQGQSIFSLAFSPDGKTLAAGDSEGNTCLYGVASRHVIGGGACLLGHRTELELGGGIEADEFAQLPDGETVLLTAGAGQGIVAWKSILWNLSDQGRVEQEITDAACRLAGRDLERNEWRAIFESTKLGDDPRLICSK
jgi:WD40 repeat protein